MAWSICDRVDICRVTLVIQVGDELPCHIFVQGFESRNHWKLPPATQVANDK